MSGRAPNLSGRVVRSNWRGAVLICRKCSRKLDGGFGPKGKTSLAKALRKATGVKKGRKAALGIIETGCLGVCPRGAVMLIDTASHDRWRMIPRGTDVEELAHDLLAGRE